ncbi:MAG: glycosyltransferase family 4 protein, partial [Olsenella sp.]|nr:glycosyltransferase family 4 protein [Olsenella sp.]
MVHSYAIFSAQYAPHVGGVESFTKNLAHELARAGNAVVVVTSRLDESPEVEVQADGVRIVRLPCHALMAGRLPIARRNARHRRLLESVASLGIDRVLVNTRFYEHSVDGLDFARRVGAPAIMLDHGSAYLTFGAGGLAGGLVDAAARAHEHLMTRRDLRRTPTFAGISRKSAAWLATFGIATDLVIPNAIDAPAFRAESSGRDFRAEFGVAPTERLVAYVGRLAGEKGPLELAAAARLLGGGYRVLMAGDGVLRAALESDLPNNVCLLGNLGHPDLSALLSQADVFCLPTRSEGFCTSLLEAGAWGVPCVVPDVGGAREVL